MLKDIVPAERFSAVDVFQVCIGNLLANPDFKIQKTDIDAFYTGLAGLPDQPNPELEDLDGAFVACVGGAYRSPKIAKYLRQKGVILSDERCTRGFSISNLPELFSGAVISEEGYLRPSGFAHPIKNLFLGLNPEDETLQCGTLFSALNSLAKKQMAGRRDITMDVYIIEGDENKNGRLYRQFRGFDPELDA